nr:aminoacyl-tRNA synthetase, class 1a, anticodon-binding [Tanacetum cinerariifolium]
ETDDGPVTNVEDEPLGGSFHMSPPRSTPASPAGQPSSGAEDLITLTALSSVVSTLVQKIRSWRLYTLSNVHVLETVSGEVVYMFADVSYPFSVKLMERMLKNKLEIDKDVVGNDMTTAEQLSQFIKNQLATAQVSSA